MNKNMKTIVGAISSAILVAHEIQKFNERRKAHREAVEALERIKVELEQFAVDVEFVKMVQEF